MCAVYVTLRRPRPGLEGDALLCTVQILRVSLPHTAGDLKLLKSRIGHALSSGGLKPPLLLRPVARPYVQRIAHFSERARRIPLSPSGDSPLRRFLSYLVPPPFPGSKHNRDRSGA